MIRSICSVTALLLATPAALGGPFEFTGTAKDNKGSVLYQEVHRVEGTCAEGVFQPVSHRVDYRKSARADSFAEKTLSYDNDASRPSVEFSQPDYQEQLTITYPDPSELAIRWQTPSGKTENFSVAFDDRVVVDAGFDHFVRANWNKVTNGESVDFRFLGPTRGEHYGFVLEPASNDQINADVVVQIRPTSFVLRFLVDPIVLGYNREGALTDYLGLTNIRMNADENYTAHIRYDVSQYPDCALTP